MEIDFLLWLQGLRQSAPDFITTALNALSSLFNGPALLLIVGLVYLCVNKKCAYYIAACYLGSMTVSQTLKLMFCVNRPWVLDARVTPYEGAVSGATGYSFPSGHTTSAVSSMGSVAAFVRKRWVTVLCVLVALLTAFSRMWLGCHTPKDVLAAILISCLVIALVSHFSRYLEAHPNHDISLGVLLLIIGIALLLVVSLKPYPVQYAADGSLLVDPVDMQMDVYRAVGAYAGFILGWIIERRAINFSVEGTLPQKILRAVVCLAIVALLYFLVLPYVLGNFDERIIDCCHVASYFAPP